MMGYVPPLPAGWGHSEIRERAPWYHPRLGVLGGDDTVPLNLDRHGMPRDYATYVWLLYRRVVEDDSPARRAFLYGPHDDPVPDFGQQVITR